MGDGEGVGDGEDVGDGEGDGEGVGVGEGVGAAQPAITTAATTTKVTSKNNKFLLNDIPFSPP